MRFDLSICLQQALYVKGESLLPEQFRTWGCHAAGTNAQAFSALNVKEGQPEGMRFRGCPMVFHPEANHHTGYGILEGAPADRVFWASRWQLLGGPPMTAPLWAADQAASAPLVAFHAASDDFPTMIIPPNCPQPY